jgi:hypothetical protein
MTTAVGPRLNDEDLPGLFEAADTASVRGQRQYLRMTTLRLWLAIAAAALGVFPVKVGDIDLAAIATALALVGVVLTEKGLQTEKPEEHWYDGRTLAESAKSLAWRFNVGAVPFQLGGDEAETEARFTEQMRQLLADAPATSIVPSSRGAVTEGMRRLRAADLAARRTSYLEQRVDDQREWYARKANESEHRARKWQNGLFVIEAAGIAAAVARAVGYVQIDLAGVVAALIAAGAAWSGMKQWSNLKRAYTFASVDLAMVRDRLAGVTSEQAWAAEVADAEEAVNREHTMWRASRSRATG